MYIYILNNRFIETEEPLDLKPTQMCKGKLVKNKYWLLDTQRTEFKINHPEASVADVLRIGFKPAPYEVNAPMRKAAYEKEADPMFIAYQKYLALGQLLDAENMRAAWLKTIKLIDERYPYSDKPSISKVYETKSLIPDSE